MKWKVIRIICQEVFLDEVKVMANVSYLQYFEILTQVLRYNTGRAIWPKNSRLDLRPLAAASCSLGFHWVHVWVHTQVTNTIAASNPTGFTFGFTKEYNGISLICEPTCEPI